MKIAFTGIAGSGKTTLVDWASKEFNLPIVKEMAKDLLGEKYPIGTTFWHLDEFFKFQQEVIEAKNKAEKEFGDNFITDRTTFDCVVFMMLRLARDRWPTDEQPGQDYGSDLMQKFFALQSMCHMDDKHYDIVFYIKPFQKIAEQDGKRNINPFYAEIFDTILMSHMLKMRDEGHIGILEFIDDESIEGRKGFIREVMEEEIERQDLRTSDEWQKLCKITVHDPDGWDRMNYKHSWFEEKITRLEFEKRMTHSTCLYSGMDDMTKLNIWRDK